MKCRDCPVSLSCWAGRAPAFICMFCGRVIFTRRQVKLPEIQTGFVAFECEHRRVVPRKWRAPVKVVDEAPSLVVPIKCVDCKFEREIERRKRRRKPIPYRMIATQITDLDKDVSES